MNEVVRTEFDDRVEYRLNGKLHRLDGPAIECADGSKEWYQEGKRHRLDGPAVEFTNGGKYWYVEDELHRLDGPAIEHANGNKEWFQEGKRHRLDGPAKYTDGSKKWFVEGKLHRLDGPAIENTDGSKKWYKEGKRHRLDGPAIECANGSKEWWIEDNQYSEEEFLKRNNKKSGKTMSYKDQVKSDMTKVAYRQGARKLTSISHAAILHVFRQQGFSESKLNVLLEFLDSKPGKALLSYGLGKGLEQMMKENETAQTLAEEFRVSGMDLGVESGLDKIAEKGLELAPALMTLLSAVEKTSQEGVNLETLQSFQQVESDLPEEYREELNNLSRLTRIKPEGPDMEIEEDLESQSEGESQSEEENIVTETSFYSACS